MEYYLLINKFLIGLTFNKNLAYYPIDYESINDIEFFVMEEDTSTIPILDYTEMENILYNEDSIPKFSLDKDEGEILNMCLLFVIVCLMMNMINLFNSDSLFTYKEEPISIVEDEELDLDSFS